MNTGCEGVKLFERTKDEVQP